MAISFARYVDIASGVIGTQVVAERELVGLRFTTDPRVPVNDPISAANADDVLQYFGASSDEYDFAQQYFSYVSPSPISRPRRLLFAAFAQTARAPRLYGAEGSYMLATFQAVTSGTLNLTMGSHQAELVGINLSSATTLADVATAIQGAIRAETTGGAQWTGATVTYDATERAFTLVGGDAVDAPVSVAIASTGTDLAPLLGWTFSATVFSPGSDQQTPVEAFAAARDVSDNFGTFSFGAVLTDDEAEAVALANAALNVEFIYLVSVTSATAAALSARLINVPSVGLVLNSSVGEYKEALIQAIVAAIVWTRRNATVNVMYRQLAGLTADVTTTADADTYDGLRVNYYGQTAKAGQQYSFLQRGYLMGPPTAPLDINVHANEQWLKSYLQARLMSLQLSLGKIAANDSGRATVLAQVVAAVQLAKNNGTISVGKVLDATQQAAVTDLTGDPEAWRDVQSKGYWADCQIVQETGPGGMLEYVAQYTLAYSKNDVVRKITGSHNLV
ncbi:DUF3383 domain-containing protein [Azorhizophilus paspali]|uniref:DUF3383 domain-containing protein n=1 Tax=Azorhizophilus paspali TaxID=69963 RepID=A0ABV6SHI1_AZOPA